jgi:hypothetical protein
MHGQKLALGCGNVQGGAAVGADGVDVGRSALQSGAANAVSFSGSNAVVSASGFVVESEAPPAARLVRV